MFTNSNLLGKIQNSLENVLESFFKMNVYRGVWSLEFWNFQLEVGILEFGIQEFGIQEFGIMEFWNSTEFWNSGILEF